MAELYEAEFRPENKYRNQSPNKSMVSIIAVHVKKLKLNDTM